MEWGMEGDMVEATGWGSAEVTQAMAEVLGEAMAEAMQVMIEGLAGAMQVIAEALDKAGALAWEEAGEEDLEWAEAIGVLGFREDGSTGAPTGGNKNTCSLIQHF